MSEKEDNIIFSICSDDFMAGVEWTRENEVRTLAARILERATKLAEDNAPLSILGRIISLEVLQQIIEEESR